MKPPLLYTKRQSGQSGFTLIELMVSIVIGLLMLAALIALMLNVSRNNTEMTKSNRMVENGRFALQLLQADLSHAGYWGGYVPEFDDLSRTTAPTDIPTAVPDPCLAYASWDSTHISNLIGIPVQSYEIPTVVPSPTLSVCANRVTSPQPKTDVLIVRRTENCLPGAPNCEALNNSMVYLQSPLCRQEISDPVFAQAATATSITLDADASAISNFYIGSTIYVLSGAGVGQNRMISAYDGTTKVASLSAAWTTIPDNTSKYMFKYTLGTDGFIFHKRDCITAAEKRKFISNLYFIRKHAVNPGDGIPTLMRSQFQAKLISGVTMQQHQSAEALIEGVEGFRVEFGIDNISDAGTNIITGADSAGVVAPANLHSAAIKWAVTTPANTSPTNRGDGSPDGAYKHCTTLVPCTATELMNVVAVKLYVLVRNDVVTPGYMDAKTYNLGSTTLGPFNDGFKRHLFTQTIRLVNVSSRRETP